MKQFPESFLQQLQADLGDDLRNFLQALETAAPVSIRFNPFKKSSKNIAIDAPIAWHTEGGYLDERPVFTLDPAFHAGVYYVQEASSMFIGEAIKQSIDNHILESPLSVLDLCAAPGGKSTLLASLISENSLLVTNEVIKSRVDILKENINKWGTPNVVVSNHDSEDFEGLEGFFDIVLIDAPCSGEGLFRKDEKAIGEWSPDSVQTCSSRQKRILANAIKLVKPDGLLLYSTCTYNDFENKNNSIFITQEFDFQSIRLNTKGLGIVEKVWQNDAQNPVYGYQFYPHKVRGEGFFLSVFKNNSDKKTPVHTAKLNLTKLPKKQVEICQKWLKNPADFEFFQKVNSEIFIVLKGNLDKITVIDKALKRKSLGTVIGEIKGTDFIPSHDLALSTAISDSIPFVDFDKMTALKFLKKENIDVTDDMTQGWVLARYNGLNLGWMKVLKNRINNYLPKDFRIRMEIF